MKEMKKKRSVFTTYFLINLLVGIAISLLGLYLLVSNSAQILVILVILFGIGSIITGVRELLQQAVYAEYKIARVTSVFTAIIDIIVGLVVLVYPNRTTDAALKLIFFLLAAQLMIAGLANLYTALTVKRKNDLSIISQVIMSFVYILLAIVCVMYRASIANSIIKIIAVIILLFGVGVFVSGLRMYNIKKQMKKQEKDIDVDVLN